MTPPRPIERARRWAYANAQHLTRGGYDLRDALTSAYWAGLMSERRRVRAERARMEKLLDMDEGASRDEPNELPDELPVFQHRKR